MHVLVGFCYLVAVFFTLVGLVFTVFSNIVANLSIAASVESLKLWNGVAGFGFCSAFVSSDAAFMAISMDDVFGIVKSLGENSTVSAMRSPLVFMMCTEWHL